MKAWHRIAAITATMYPIALLGVTAAFRYLGERWWVTGVWLYLPRVLLAAPLPIIVVALVAAGPRRVLWTQVVASLLLLFPLMGFVVPWPIVRNRDAPVVRILSYNVDSVLGGAGNLVEEVERHSPDIVLLQEVVDSEPLLAALRARYPTVNAEGQFLIASKYPVLSTTAPEKIPYDGRMRSPRFVQQVLDTPLGRIVLYHVHPISPRETFNAIRQQGLKRQLVTGRLFSRTNAAIVQENFGLRSLQVQAFAEAARRESDPVVIAGDTNLPGLSFVLHRELSGYQDGFAKAGWGFGYTFPTTRRPWMRIDRVFASEELRFVRFEVGRALASDHRCVVADLQRRDP
jgi:vancomycin resistance protein VanJ